ncbi:hypothetical protein [Burkholderia gladioli]|uniref:hypothetical protein n=1 Tax=Burkholderia gladioli TaxID=28095 RepID=UPI0016423124|nr:hypothetical protein [Burkholderia gladioli]
MTKTLRRSGSVAMMITFSDQSDRAGSSVEDCSDAQQHVGESFALCRSEIHPLTVYSLVFILTIVGYVQATQARSAGFYRSAVTETIGMISLCGQRLRQRGRTHVQYPHFSIAMYWNECCGLQQATGRTQRSNTSAD